MANISSNKGDQYLTLGQIANEFSQRAYALKRFNSKDQHVKQELEALFTSRYSASRAEPTHTHFNRFHADDMRASSIGVIAERIRKRQQ